MLAARLRDITMRACTFVAMAKHKQHMHSRIWLWWPEPGACTCSNSKTTGGLLLAGRSILGAGVPSGPEPEEDVPLRVSQPPSRVPGMQCTSDSDVGRGQTTAIAAAEGRTDRAHLDLRELRMRIRSRGAEVLGLAR